MTVYQIQVRGPRKCFEGEGKFNSKQVYKNKPSQSEIDAFVDKCCNTPKEKGASLLDLDSETVKVTIIELILIEN